MTLSLKNISPLTIKKIFGPSDHNNLVMDESYRDNIPQVTLRKMISWLLSLRRRRLEVQIFQMNHNTTDGFPPEFYQVFWNVIKDDLMALFIDFH
jgi:hypothetical protein